MTYHYRGIGIELVVSVVATDKLASVDIHAL
jgi:hypothetical protein